MSNRDVKVEYNMPFNKYLEVRAMSASSLKRLYASYRDYLCESINASRKTLDRGRALHKIILEYQSFFDSYSVLPDGKDRRSREYKDMLRDSIVTEKEILTSGEFEEYMSIRKSVLENPDAAVAIKGEHEVSVFWNDPQFGASKARFDILASSYVGDLKMVSPLQFMSFGRQAYYLGYDIQAAWYLRAAKAAGFSEGIKNFQFIFVIFESSGASPDSSVQIAPEEMVIGGEEKISAALENLATVYANEEKGIRDAFYGKIPGVSFVDYRLEYGLPE